MGWDGAGGYNRQRNFSADASAGIKILASAMDQEIDDVASAMQLCWARDGQNTPTGNIPMGGYRLINVGNAASVSDFITAKQVIENVPVYMEDTTTSVDTVSVSAQFFTSVSAGQAPAGGTKILVKVGSHKQSAPVLKFSGHSANIYFPGGGAVDGLVSAAVHEFIYNSADSVWETGIDRLHPRTDTEITAGVTPSNFQFAPGDVRRYGAIGDNSTDCTQAFTDALASNVDIYIPPGNFRVLSTLTVSTARSTVRGDGIQSTIVFNPSSNNDELFTATNQDNISFVNFQINGNVGTATGKRGFNFDSTNSRIILDRVYCDTLDGYAFRHDQSQYDQLINCRFLNTGNGTDDNGVAVVFATWANRVQVIGCRFGNNDRDISVASGNAITIRDCSFELTGSLMGNTANWDTSVEIQDCAGVTIENNYMEGIRTSATAGVITLKSSSTLCAGASIKNNHIVADVGGTTYSKNLVYLAGDVKGAEVSHNSLQDGTSGVQSFIKAGNHKVIAYGNYYVDQGAEVSAHNSIMALISSPELVELDVAHTFTYDPGSLADGAGETTSTTMTGVALGDFIDVAAPYDLQDITVTAYAQAANTVEVRVQNESGGVIDLASGTWKIMRRIGDT